jgi:hypothetical protein
MQLYRPMTPGGGAFLICVGTALLATAWLPWSIGGLFLIGGFVLGGLAIMATSIAGRRRGLPKPSRRDIVLVWIPVAVEMAVFVFLFPHLPPDPRLQMMAVLAVVGLHFLPMAWSFGPLIAGLGVACIAVAATGQLVTGIPTAVVIAVDGALKLGFGLVMFAGLFRAPPAPAISAG